MTDKPDNILGGMREALDTEEKYLLEHFTADCGIMSGDVEGSFHRLREALAAAPVAERGEPGDLAQEAANLSGILRYMEETNARRFEPAHVSTCIALVRDRLLRASPSADADAVRRDVIDFIEAKHDWPREWICAALRGENDGFRNWRTLASPRPAVGEEK